MSFEDDDESDNDVYEVEVEGESNDEDNEEDIIDDANITFRGHSGTVFCCNFSKDSNLAASGGEDDLGFVWNTNTGENIFTCTGHHESVIYAGFNHDSSLVATADMNGLIQVRDVNENFAVVWNFEAEEITWMQWHQTQNVLLAGTVGGECWVWSIPDGDPRILPSHGAQVTCGQLMPDGEKFVVGYNDGTVRIWNQKYPYSAGSDRGIPKHKDNVTSIACSTDGTLIASSSMDCTVKLIKPDNNKVLWDIPVSEEEEDSIESVNFLPTVGSVVTGSRYGELAVWDLSRKVNRYRCSLEGTVVRLICSPTSPSIFAASSNIVYHIDSRTGDCARKWLGHKEMIYDLALSEDQRKILTASDDSTCKIFTVSQC